MTAAGGVVCDPDPLWDFTFMMDFGITVDELFERIRQAFLPRGDWICD